MTQLASDSAGHKIQAIRQGTHQSVAYTGTAGTIANVITAGCTIVRVVTTTAAYVKIGASPTATTSHMYMPADSVEFFSCSPDGTEKVSAVQVSSGGTLHVTEAF